MMQTGIKSYFSALLSKLIDRRFRGILPLFALFIVLIITIIDLNNYQNVSSRAYVPNKVFPITHFEKRKLDLPFHILQTIPSSRIPAKFSANATGNQGYIPDDIKRAYNLPSLGGHGTIAIIDAFDTPTAENDLNAFSNKFGLPACASSTGCFSVHYQSGKPPPQNTNWQFETDLDIEWAHAIAPNANILLIELNSDTNINDVLTGLDYARHQTDVVAVSMSFGTSEAFDEQNADIYFDSVSGAAFIAASGDSGNGVSWPAVSAKVIGVGGTSLISGSTINETAWSKSGGGLSKFIAEPDYQNSLNIPNANGKRGVPDVSAVADPQTGCIIYGPDGKWYVIGGTSLSAPIWAGIAALGNSPLTSTILYQNAKNHYGSYYRDITSGSNGTCSNYCTAGTGYDYVTGLGSPIALPLTNGSTSPTPSNPPSKTPTPVLSPTPTGNPTLTNLSVTIGLHGIANGGDNVNPSSKGNMDPHHKKRTLTVTVISLQNQILQQSQGLITFDQVSGLFAGVIGLGSLPTGDYQLKLKTDGFLVKAVGQIIHINKGQITQLPAQFLINGDINGDNLLNLSDYSALADCFGTKQNSSSCKNPITQTQSGSDLDDSGVIDGADYNLLLREFSVQNGN